MALEAEVHDSHLPIVGAVEINNLCMEHDHLGVELNRFAAKEVSDDGDVIEEAFGPDS